MNDTIHTLAQRCYDLATKQDRPTRDVALDIVATTKPSLLRAMAVEFLVDVVSREHRAATLEAERAAQSRTRAQHAEIDNSAAMGEWQQDADAAEERSLRKLTDNLMNALNKYTEDLRVQWTAELLDSTFALGDGSTVAWGDATIEQHEERRQMFLRNSRANMEGAARHESALRDLRESGAPTLRTLVKIRANA